MNHNCHPSRQQLRPSPQIQNSLPRNIKPEHETHDPSNRPRGDDLTSPRDRRRPKREIKRIDLLPSDVRLVVKGEIRIDIFVSTVVQYQNLAEEGEHGHVLGHVADEDAAAAVLSIVGVGLVV